ncbi:MAG: DUF6531 domain-containing protein, partial [Limnohabitans sp.]|nr:DUF6531 domain-containing protein [Limnohabitans sp.]
MLLADNHFTPVIGLDIHFTVVPPYNPFHPYIGMVIDPADYIPFIGATVQVNGIKRGVSDTSGIIMPFVHIPLVGSFAAPPIIGHESMNVFSSLTVFADGSRLSPKSYMVFTCNDIGLPLSASLAPNPKKPGKLTLIPTLFAPTSFSLPIPTGMPVNVGGPYAPDWGGVLMGLLMSIGFSSLLRLGKKMFNKALKKMAGDNSLSKLLCKLGFEPINLVNGNVIYEGTDFEMQGPLPLQWERKWSSYSAYKGWLGYGTHNNYDRTVELFPDEDAIGVRTADGRVVAFPLLVEGESFYLRQEKTTLSHKGHYFTAFDHATKQTFYFEQFNGYNVYRLTRIVNAVGFEIQLQVSGNRLEGIIDSSGRAYKVTSNIKGCIEKIELKEPTGDSILVSYEYDDQDNLIAIKDALGKATTIIYENHLMVQKTDRNGQTFYWEYDGPTTGAKCIHTWGDGGWQEGWIEYFPEEGYNLVTDANGAVTTYYYTPDQLVTQIKDPLGNSTFTQYTDFMEVYRNIDEEGYITGYSYDENGNLTAISYPDGNVSHMAYDENDQLIVTIDPEGSKMVYTYSEENPYLVSSIIEPDNGITTFEYNDKGLIASVAKGEQKVFLEYDNQHNLTQLTNHEGTSTQWQYNYRGQTLHVKTPNLYPQSFFYDTLGRVTKIQSNSKGETRLAYNAYEEIVEIQDTQRHIKLDYTPMGSLRRREENGVSVFFAYDKMEQLLAITNEHNERYEFTRNNAGNIIKEEGFDGMIRTFNLDATGKTIKVNRPGDKHSLYEYDPMGKVTRIEHHDGTWELFGYNKRGQLTEARNQNVCVALTRDAMGRVVKETQTHGVLGDKGFEIISEYDKNGNRVVLKSSLGAEQKNSFDSLGNLENIQAQTTALLENQKQAWETHIKRNALGQEVERIVSGGLTISTDYDVNGNILSHKAKSNQRETFHRVYHWNGNQQLQRVVDAITGGDTHFTYDAFGNLAKAQYKNGDVDYKLPDEVGNLYKSWLRND